MVCGLQVLTESYSSSGPYSIRTAVKAAFIQLLLMLRGEVCSTEC